MSSHRITSSAAPEVSLQARLLEAPQLPRLLEARQLPRQLEAPQLPRQLPLAEGKVCAPPSLFVTCQQKTPPVTSCRSVSFPRRPVFAGAPTAGANPPPTPTSTSGEGDDPAYVLLHKGAALTH